MENVDAEREAEFVKASAPQVARNVASCLAWGKPSKELRGRRGSGNAEGKFRSCNAGQISRQSGNAYGDRRRNSVGYQMRSCRLVGKVARLAICAGFSAMVMPSGAANQREHKKDRGEYSAESKGSNCAVLLHV